MTLTDADHGKTFDIRMGDAVVVRLPENAATGFRWALDESSEEGVEVAGSTYVPAGAGIGGAGYTEWTFRARRPGAVALKLKQWRQWEGEASVSNRFEVLLEVGA
jgi:inhibitor of cysteine peptidase